MKRNLHPLIFAAALCALAVPAAAASFPTAAQAKQDQPEQQASKGKKHKAPPKKSVSA